MAHIVGMSLMEMRVLEDTINDYLDEHGEELAVEEGNALTSILDKLQLHEDAIA